MDLGLSQSTFIITGGTSGIGLAVVSLLLREGANVVTCSRSPERMESNLRSLYNAFPNRLHWQQADVHDSAQMADLIDATVKRFGTITGVVNNAGQSHLSTFRDTSLNDWHNEFSLKIGSVVNTVQPALPFLEENGAVASVVNINAILAREPNPQLIATSAGRAALLNMSVSMAHELASDGIRVNSVAVGLIDTGQSIRRYEASETEESYEAWKHNLAHSARIPLGRIGEPEDVANVVAFLLSSRSAYVTGTVIDVDGGKANYM